MDPDNLIKVDFFKSLKILKMQIEKSPKTPDLYRTTGLVFEIRGKLKTALKFYLIFLELNGKGNLYTTRILFFFFWNEMKIQSNPKLIKKKNYLENLSQEGKFFWGKVYEKLGFFSFSQNLWEKIYRRCGTFIMKKWNWIKDLNLIKLYFLSFRFRALIKEMNLNFNCFQFKRIFKFLFIFDQIDSEKLSYLFHDLLELQSKYKSNILEMINFSKFTKNEIYSKISLASRILILFHKKDPDDQGKFKILETLKYLGAFPKWLVQFGHRSLLQKPDYSFLIQKPNFINRGSLATESFNPFFRNHNLKTGLYLQIVRSSKAFNRTTKVLEIYQLIAFDQPENSGVTSFLINMQKKLFPKMKTDEAFLREAKIRIKKAFGNVKKNQKLNIKKLMCHLEKFFEENKIVGLSRLLTSILLHLVKPGKKEVKRGTLKGQKSSESSNSDFLNGIYPKKKNDFTNSLFISSEKLFFFLEKLVEKTLFFLFKKRKFSLEKPFKFLFGNLTFFKKVSSKTKFFSIYFLIQRRKFLRAYKLLRIECLRNPNLFQGWYFLSNIEKETGLIASKTLRFSLRVLFKSPEAVPGIVFTGSHCSNFGSFGYALAEFFQAFRWKKHSPFLNFSIGLQYLYGSLSRRNYFKGFAIILSLCFLGRYKNFRNFTIQNFLKRNDLSIILEKELDFNFGKFYLFLGLNLLGFKYFKKVKKKNIKLSRFNKMKRPKKLSLVWIFEIEVILNSYLLNLCFGNK